MIIGISGRAGAGKDTCANFLTEQGIINGKISIADSLKLLCNDLFNTPIEDMYNHKEKPTDIKITPDLIKFAPLFDGRENEFMSVRELLQVFGTDVVRKFNPDCWINLTINKIKTLPGNIYAVPDVRFPNEVEAIQRAGGIVLRLTRNPFDLTHITETTLDDYNGFDLKYDNEGEDVNDTINNVAKIIKEKINESK